MTTTVRNEPSLSSQSSRFFSFRNGLAICLAAGYSATLHMSLSSPLPSSSDKTSSGWIPYLPLRHSNLGLLLIHVLWQAGLISLLSNSRSHSFGTCLHLFKIPLLSTVYNYFNLTSKLEILKSLIFDLINYSGQYVIFKQLRAKSSKKGSDATSDEENVQKNHKQVVILSWILVSLIDGLMSFLMSKTLGEMIEKDVGEYVKKSELDQYFLLTTSARNDVPISHILRAGFKDRLMLTHQLISPLINLPYLLSWAGLISIPSDLVLLDRLTMITMATRLRLFTWLATRRLLNGVIVWYLGSWKRSLFSALFLLKFWEKNLSRTIIPKGICWWKADRENARSHPIGHLEFFT